MSLNQGQLAALGELVQLWPEANAVVIGASALEFYYDSGQVCRELQARHFHDEWRQSEPTAERSAAARALQWSRLEEVSAECTSDARVDARPERAFASCSGTSVGRGVPSGEGLESRPSGASPGE